MSIPSSTPITSFLVSRLFPKAWRFSWIKMQSLQDIMRSGDLALLKAYEAKASRKNWRVITKNTHQYMWAGKPCAEVGRLFLELHPRLGLHDGDLTPLEKFQIILKQMYLYQQTEDSQTTHDHRMALLLSILEFLHQQPEGMDHRLLYQLIARFPQDWPSYNSTQHQYDFFTPFHAFLRARLPFESATAFFYKEHSLLTPEWKVIARLLQIYHGDGYTFLRDIFTENDLLYDFLFEETVVKILLHSTGHEHLTFCARLQDADVQSMTAHDFLSSLRAA